MCLTNEDVSILRYFSGVQDSLVGDILLRPMSQRHIREVLEAIHIEDKTKKRGEYTN